MKDTITLRFTARRQGEVLKVMWTDSRTCPAVAEAVDALRSVPMPTPVVPGDPENIILHGVGYSVRFNGRYGSEMGVPLELRSNAGTPLAAWVSDIFRRLKPCWSETRPS
ncbi:hypothetical protein [Sphingomonas turrisvirgatae]|uniref:hypothetical protein n=1 Tax=Sphingomonas turrisvirgatae TaxID=1888892 RepID=UPI001042406F|nr:hypothetical protein [Sphingomonas turrisvirgatae]